VKGNKEEIEDDREEFQALIDKTNVYAAELQGAVDALNSLLAERDSRKAG
jgi:hypothetical protein